MKKELLKLLNSVKFDDEILMDYYAGDDMYYLKDKQVFDKAKAGAKELLKSVKITKAEMKEACKTVFSGRLEYDGVKFKYIAGQFYDLELPQAIYAVLSSIVYNN